MQHAFGSEFHIGGEGTGGGGRHYQTQTSRHPDLTFTRPFQEARMVVHGTVFRHYIKRIPFRTPNSHLGRSFPPPHPLTVYDVRTSS